MRPVARLVQAMLFTLAALPAAAASQLNVVATTPDYAALAAAVGGDRVKIKTLAKPTEDPHFVDARPSHVVTLNRADVLIESGAGLEVGWLSPLVEGARNKDLLPGGRGRVAGSTGVKLFDVPATLDRSQGDVHAAGNPHFLMDPANARIVATTLARVFCERSPTDCPAFETNLANFKQRLDTSEKAWSARLAPFAGRSIVTYHNTWRYFAERFGLRAEVFLEPKPGIPPSPPHLAEVIREMQEQGMKAILVEPFQSEKTAASVASRVGAEVVHVCQFPGGLAGTEGDYISLMQANVEAVAHALEVAP
jgi:ABC-type Zn uptake system ZnuABC Zn-binding protein ZnuA